MATRGDQNLMVHVARCDMVASPLAYMMQLLNRWRFGNNETRASQPLELRLPGLGAKSTIPVALFDGPDEGDYKLRLVLNVVQRLYAS